MKKILNRIIFRNHCIYCCEEDVTRVISTINSTRGFLNLIFIREPQVHNCGWRNSNVWCIVFKSSSNQWKFIKNNLLIKRIWREDIPINIERNIFYSTD